MGKTLYDKIWDAHLVQQKPGERPFSILTGIWCMR